jgi:nucleoside-diphosphate-sugar epimerase
VETIARQLGRRLLPLPFPLPAAYLLALACEAAFYPFDAQPVLSRWRLKTLTSDFALDCSSLENLGYRPTVSFEEGVRQTIDWYRSQGLLRRR